MTTLTITLPKALGAFLEKEIAAGNFASPDDYIRRILERKKLESLLLERIDAADNGDASEMTKKDWDRLRINLRKKISDRKANAKKKSNGAASGSSRIGNSSNRRVHRS